MPPGEGMGQGAAVDVFQFAPQGDAMGDARGPHPLLGGNEGDVLGRGATLDRGADGQDQLLDPCLP